MAEDSTCPGEGDLYAYFSGSADRDKAGEIRRHLATCERCRMLVDRMDSDEDNLPGGDGPAASLWTKTTLAAGGAANTRETAEALADIQILLQPSTDREFLGRVGVYEITSVLGRGGMGIVFRAFDTALHRTVAIKVLSPQLATSPRARRRFQREACAAAGINHPNVVTIHSVDEQSGLPYLVMEYVSGRTLRERLKISPPLDQLSVVRISAQIADGLAAAHRHGIIHRDIKPSNILLEDGVERVKISDFGLALVTMDLTHLTSVGQTVGTPGYMSPEQITGRPIDTRNDLFGLGCLMYAMVTGGSPFRGSHPMEIAHRIVKSKPTPLHKKDPSVPRPFSDVVSRLLEKDPNRRYQTAEEVCDLLRQQLALARGEPSDTLLALTLAPKRASRGRRIPAILILGAVLLVAGGLAAVVAINGGGRKPSDAETSARAVVEDPVQDRIAGRLTVGQTSEAQFRSISEALRRAAPGAVVTIVDDAEYQEALQMVGSVSNGLTLESPSGARLAPPAGAGAAVVVDTVAGATIRGLQIRLKKDQHAVVVMGACPGLLLERLQCSQPEGTGYANVYLKDGASGSADQPICIRQCILESYAMGVYIQGETNRAASSVEILDNRFLGTAAQLLATHILRDVSVRGNLFAGGGLSLSLSGEEQSGGIDIGNNTFSEVSLWLAIDRIEKADGVDIYNNLILGGQGVGSPGWLQNLAPGWSFRNNLWETDERTDENAARVATTVDQVDLLSRDKSDVGYLRPAAGSTLATAGVGGDRPAYVGALAPLSNDLSEKK